MKQKIALDKLTPILTDKLHVTFNSLKEQSGVVSRKQMEQSLVIQDGEENVVIAKISSPAIDRSGEVLDPEGCDYSEFLNNPIVFWSHDYSILPIAKVEHIQKDSRGVYAKIKFGTTEECKKIYQLIKDGILRANSVGFYALATLENGTREFNEYLKTKFSHLVEKKNEITRIITKWVLLENSICGLGCNQEALILAVAQKQIDQKFLDKLNIKFTKNEQETKDVDKEEKESTPEVSKEMDEEEEKSEIAIKPIEGWHTFRITDPSKYEDFRTEENAFGEGINVIYGLYKDGEEIKSEVQSIRFNALMWTFEEAKKWIEENNYTPIEEEPASEPEEEPEEIEEEACTDDEEKIPCDEEDDKKAMELIEDVQEKTIELIKEPEIKRYITLVRDPIDILVEKKIKKLKGKIL